MGNRGFQGFSGIRNLVETIRQSLTVTSPANADRFVMLQVATGFLKAITWSNILTTIINALKTRFVLSAFGLLATVPASSTRYIFPFGDTLETVEPGVSIPFSGTLKDFYFRIGTGQPASGNMVVTLLKNSVATAITITIAAGEGAGTKSDTTHSVSFVGGDYFSWKIVNNATGNSATIGAISTGILFDLVQS